MTTARLRLRFWHALRKDQLMTASAEPGGPARPRTLNEAYTQLYQPLYEFVWRRAAAMHDRIQLTDDDAEDLVEQVFNAARAAGWSTLAHPRTWLYVVARHQLHLIATYQRADLPSVTWAPTYRARRSAGIGFAAIVAAQAVCDRPRELQAAYLRFCERWTIPEIADALGVSEDAAWQHSDGARHALEHGSQFPSSRPPDPARQRADLAVVFTTLTAGGLAAATGVLLGGIWQTVLGIAGVMLAAATTLLGLRYLWTEHLHPWWADRRRDHKHAAPLPPSPLARVLLLLIRCYQQDISPRLAPRCRFTPTCSAYAQQALNRHGAGRGIYLAARRILRCRPGVPRGHDPVPTRQQPINL